MRFLIIMLFLFSSAWPAVAGAGLNMEDAERLFMENNPDIKSMKIELQKSDAAVLESRALPNPAARYSLESLKNGGRETEETYSISQEVDITGRRGRRTEAALKSREAAELILGHEIAGLLVQMKQSFYKILLFKENEKTLSAIAAFFSDAEEKIDARVKAGDASEAALMKLAGEKKKTLRGLDALRTDLNAEKRRLALLLNSRTADFEISGEFVYKPFKLETGELTELLQKNRPDIKGRDKTIEAARALVAASKREVFQSVELEAGYKKRTGGFNGFIFGVSIPLPLFNRNQGGIALGQAGLDQEKAAAEALKRTAIYELNVLFDRITSLQARIADLSGQIEISRELTKIAGISYEEGEAGLLDFLDAVRSEKELATEYNSLVYEYWASLFELEKVSATKLTQTGGVK